jgi:hypothetical protein
VHHHPASVFKSVSALLHIFPRYTGCIITPPQSVSPSVLCSIPSLGTLGASPPRLHPPGHSPVASMKILRCQTCLFALIDSEAVMRSSCSCSCLMLMPDLLRCAGSTAGGTLLTITGIGFPGSTDLTRGQASLDITFAEAMAPCRCSQAEY